MSYSPDQPRLFEPSLEVGKKLSAIQAEFAVQAIRRQKEEQDREFRARLASAPVAEEIAIEWVDESPATALQ